MPSLPIACTECEDGWVDEMIHWTTDTRKEPCQTCHGRGHLMCDCCCRAPATVVTGDAEYPHACAECAAYLETEDHAA